MKLSIIKTNEMFSKKEIYHSYKNKILLIQFEDPLTPVPAYAGTGLRMT